MTMDWVYVGVFFLIALLLPGAAIFIAGLLAPKKPNAIKNTIYECGMETVGKTWVQFRVQYYVFALAFLVFDVEAIFLFPWAAAYNQLALYAALEGVLFIMILGGGLYYAIRKGALEWR